MTGNEDNAVFFPGVFRYDVMNLELALWSVSSERIVFDFITLEMGGDVVLNLLVGRATQRARPKFHDVFDVLHGAVAVGGGKGPWIGWKGDLLDGCNIVRRGSLSWAGVLVAIAGQNTESKSEQDYRKVLRSTHDACFSLRAARCFGCTSQ